MKIQVSASAILLWAALLLLLPLQWVGAAILAAIVHESCHAIAVCLLGGKIQEITIHGRGVVMDTVPMSGVRELVCLMAGPIGSIMLLAAAPRLPRTAICGLVHGIYNLIPLFPLDGGRIVKNALYSFLSPPMAQKMFMWSQRIVAVLIIFGCSILALRWGIVPLMFGIYAVRNQLWENTLAKKLFWRYNRSNIDKEVRP